MAYCDLLEVNERGAVYMYGPDATTKTGKVQFYREYKTPLILQEPKEGHVRLSDLCGVAIKHKANFAKGVFPQKVAFEYC